MFLYCDTLWLLKVNFKRMEVGGWHKSWVVFTGANVNEVKKAEWAETKGNGISGCCVGAWLPRLGRWHSGCWGAERQIEDIVQGQACFMDPRQSVSPVWTVGRGPLHDIDGLLAVKKRIFIVTECLCINTFLHHLFKKFGFSLSLPWKVWCRRGRTAC